MNYNRLILGGRLTRDPETRYTASQTAVVRFGLAVNNRRKDASGEWVEDPHFFDVTIWGKRGEAFAKYHRKGDPAFLEGELRYSTWHDRATGEKRSKVSMTAHEWQFVGSKRDASSSSDSPKEGWTVEDDGSLGDQPTFTPESPGQYETNLEETPF